MQQDEQLEISTIFKEEKPEYILEQMKPFR